MGEGRSPALSPESDFIQTQVQTRRTQEHLVLSHFTLLRFTEGVAFSQTEGKTSTSKNTTAHYLMLHAEAWNHRPQLGGTTVPTGTSTAFPLHRWDSKPSEPSFPTPSPVGSPEASLPPPAKRNQRLTKGVWELWCVCSFHSAHVKTHQ